MKTIADDDRYSALARLARSGVFDRAEDDPDANFEFSLQRILDGVQALIDARAARRMAAPR